MSPERVFRVLVADASDMLRDLLSYGVTRHFKMQGAKVDIVCAADGATAWSRLHEAPYDLAIIDSDLESLKGTALVGRIRAEDKLRELTVVCTSIGGDEVGNEMLAAGANEFLSKPVALRQLAKTLETLSPG